MAMGWLKGLVAPAAFADGNPQGAQPGMAPGGPPMGGGPSPYGMQPGMQPPQGGAPSYDASGLNSPMQWSTGTKTQGGASAAGPSGVSPSAVTGAGVGPAPVGSLEARCVQLQH